MTNDDGVRLATRPTDAAPAGPPSLASGVNVTTWGHLSWLTYAWGLAVAAVVAIVTVAWARDATLDASVSEQVAVGIVRWFFLAAGVSTALSFIPLFVSNGVTRTRLASATTASLVILSAIGAAVVTVGFVVERLVATRAGWQLVLVDDGPPLDAGTIATRVVAVIPLFAAYFVTGWFIGLGFYRYSTGVGIVLIAPSLIPALLVGVLVDSQNNVIGAVGAMEEWLDPIAGLPSAVALPLAAGVVAVGCLVARRITRDTPLR